MKRDKKAIWMGEYESLVCAAMPELTGKIDWMAAMFHYNAGHTPKAGADRHISIMMDPRIPTCPVLVYDNVEIHPVSAYEHFGTTSYERCEPDDPNAVWCVFLHCCHGGVRSLADCTTKLEADALASVIVRNLHSFQHLPT